MFLQVLQPYLLFITLGAILLSIICLVLSALALVKASALRKRLRQWSEIASGVDLEHVFTRTETAVHDLKDHLDLTEQSITAIEERLARKVSTPVLQRYNAFAEMGSDLSYSVAMLDDEGNGVVMTSIYGRDDSVTYGKPVESGDSVYQLTGEEQQVIRHALGHLRERERVNRQ